VRFWAVAGLLAVAVVARAEDAIDVERRVVSFIGKSIVPGTPLVVSDLYNKAFTQPEERKVLDKLNKAAFRLPLFLVEQQAALRRPPTLKEISDQFGFFGPEESDVVLRILESDPRVPRFFERDARTKEIVSVDAAKIKADRRFGQVVERGSSASEGQPAPDISGAAFDGREANLAALRGKVVLLYVWFTNCPPCTRQTPELSALAETYRERGLSVLGINADRQLELPYDDDARAAYLKKHGVSFPNIHLTPAIQSALGEVSVFPTLFLVGRDGKIARHYINYQSRDILQKDIEAALGPGGA